jgi:SSS family transporter
MIAKIGLLRILLALAASCCACCVVPSVALSQPLVWSSLPAIPDEHGFAGAFAGDCIPAGHALVVAGGANFPAGKPWEGGAKHWHDSVFVLGSSTGPWKLAGKLPRPLGYGVSITTDAGIVCLGGADGERHYADAFLLTCENDNVAITPLPPLPQPCAYACGALVGDTLYVAGGTSTPQDTTALNSFWAINVSELTRPSHKTTWRELPTWPGPPRMLAVAAAQGESFYLFSGVSLHAGEGGRPERTYLQDAYRYHPSHGWQELASLPHPVAAAPSPAPAVGPAHILVLGGDDGSQLATPPAEHRGFSREVLAYDTRGDRWSIQGELPRGLVTTAAIPWRKQMVVAGGETGPGVRSTDVFAADVVARKAHFGWLNYAALVGYLLGMVGIGWYCSARNKTTDDYFKAGGRIPWWAAGLSIYATMLSSLTFMAIPAKSFDSDWTFFWANVPILLLAPIVIRFYLPFFRQLDVTSAYEYLERRFNLAARLYGSAAFILFQIGRQAIVLLLPALALATVSDLDVNVCIVLMGVLCVAYTVMGGIEAVVWTDVAQSAVLLGAAIISLILIVWQFGGTPSEFWATIGEHRKLHMFNWTLDARTSANAFWVILVGNLFITLVPYTSDQAIVQRYLTTVDEKQAARAIWTNAILSIPSTALFFAIGTALFVFYRWNPGEIDIAQTTDAIFPAFIVSQLPAGIAGLVIAGIFAAAQSTVSGSLNSVVTALMTDFYDRLGWRRRELPEASEGQRLRLARWLTAAIGLLATATALVLAESGLHSLWDTYNELVGLAASGLAGLFALGIFTRRATGTGALIGALSSAAALYLVQRYTHLHFFLYALIGVTTCVVIGWLASCLLPHRQRSIAGLTIYDRRSES